MPRRTICFSVFLTLFAFVFFETAVASERRHPVNEFLETLQQINSLAERRCYDHIEELLGAAAVGADHKDVRRDAGPEPCLVGDRETGHCLGSGGFGGNPSIVLSVENSLRALTGRKDGRFLPVDQHQVWQLPACGDVAAIPSVQTVAGFSGHTLALGLESTGADAAFSDIGVYSSDAESMMLLHSCAHFQPKNYDGKQRCRELNYLKTSGARLPAKVGVPFAWATKRQKRMLGVDWSFGQYRATSSLAERNQNKKQHMVMYRFNQLVHDTKSNQKRIVYLVAFDHYRERHNLNANDLVALVQVPVQPGCR